MIMGEGSKRNYEGILAEREPADVAAYEEIGCNCFNIIKYNCMNIPLMLISPVGSVHMLDQIKPRLSAMLLRPVFS